MDLERLEIKLIRRLRYKFGKDRCYNMANGGRGGSYRNKFFTGFSKKYITQDNVFSYIRKKWSYDIFTKGKYN